MFEHSLPHYGDWKDRKLKEFFITTGFYDLLPAAEKEFPVLSH